MTINFFNNCQKKVLGICGGLVVRLLAWGARDPGIELVSCCYDFRKPAFMPRYDWYTVEVTESSKQPNQIQTRAPKGTDRSPEYNEYFCYELDSRVKINVSKIWLRNGTKNNNTSSHMLLDHCYAFDLSL